MKLRITTPLAVVIDEDGVLALRAEDRSGSFGILPHHAEFLTSLAISVVSWQAAAGNRRFCAVRGGVLSINAASSTTDQEIAIATREAVPGDDLATLEQTVVAKFRTDTEAERTEHMANTQLQMNAIRQIVGRLHGTSVDFA